MKISIIGGGPAGNYLAYLLAKEGKDVVVFEDHKEIGLPIQCSGVITPEIEKLIPLPKDIIINKINRVRFYSPDNNFFEVKIKEDYVFERSKLDKHIAKLAENQGAKFRFNKRFLGLEEVDNKIKIKFQDGTEEITEILVGADGPFSQVAKSAGIYGERKFIYGMQARVEIEIEDKHRVDIFLGYGEFGWSIPEDEKISRVGIVKEKEPKEDFNKLIKRLNAKIINYQSGMIPQYSSKIKTQKKNIFLIGDAATMVKGSTHGGILYSMIAGEKLKEAIIKNKKYSKLWRRRLSKDLWLNKKIRETLFNFSENDFNELVRLFSQEKLKRVLSEHTRDFPSKFLFQLLIKEPRLLKFIKKAL